MAEQKQMNVILVRHTLAPEETELAVFSLVYVDPESARRVFSMLETDGSYVDAQLDSQSNQLYVRATPAKLEEIRRLLIKMGEKELEKMKPFADVSENGSVTTDGRRFYMKPNDPRNDEQGGTTSSVDSQPIDIANLTPDDDYRRGRRGRPQAGVKELEPRKRDSRSRRRLWRRPNQREPGA